jgi:hypothetical protein
MGIRIPLQDGVMVVSWVGLVVLAAIPLVFAAIIYLFFSVRRKVRQKDD